MSRFELHPEVVALSAEYDRVLSRAAAGENGARLSLVRPADRHNVVSGETRGDTWLVFANLP